jgi:hypothetical protein
MLRGSLTSINHYRGHLWVGPLPGEKEMDPELTKALNDFNVLLELLIGKKDKSEAYQLLRQINLPLVKRYYKDNPPPNRPPELFDLIEMLQESVKREDKYREQLKSIKGPASARDKRCRHCAGMNVASATVCEKCGNSFE